MWFRDELYSLAEVSLYRMIEKKSVYLKFLFCNWNCRSQWPRGLRRRSAAARLLRSWVRIPPGAWMFVCCEYCVLSGRGLCDELITRPEESYRLWCVVVCDLETSRMRRSWPALARSATGKKNNWNYTYTGGKECRMFSTLTSLYTVGWPERFLSHTVPVSRKQATKRNTVDLSGTWHYGKALLKSSCHFK